MIPATGIYKRTGHLRKLLIDGDATGQGECALCGSSLPRVFIRLREKAEGGTNLVGHICPTCVVRMFHKVVQLQLFARSVEGFARRLLGLPTVPSDNEKVVAQYTVKGPTGPFKRPAMATAPKPVTFRRALDKLIPGKD